VARKEWVHGGAGGAECGGDGGVFGVFGGGGVVCWGGVGGGWGGVACLCGFGLSVMTVSKTVLYCEFFCFFSLARGVL